MLAKEASWIPFHVVACTSEEHGTQADLLSTQSHQSQRSWESSRTGQYPIDIIIRFHYRSEIHHVLLCCKPDKGIPVIEFYIGDGLNGSFLDAEYRLAGKYDFVQNLPVQVKLMGIGNYLKIRIPKASVRNPQNPFGQVSLAILKVWGRYTNYMSKIKNETMPIVNDKSNVDKLLIGMGIPVDMINWFDQDARMFEHAPIDEDTRTTLQDMLKIKDIAIREEDYEGLKSLADDIKIVFEIGKEIWSLKREINFCIAKEDYPRAMELKKRLKLLEGKRDGYDALYETSRYVLIYLPNYFHFNWKFIIVLLSQDLPFKEQAINSYQLVLKFINHNKIYLNWFNNIILLLTQQILFQKQHIFQYI